MPFVINDMQWSVNEQCVEFSECIKFRPFIEAGKPVFHIEYPKSTTSISDSITAQLCNDTDAKGFSTLLKNLNLDEFTYEC